MLSWAKQVRKSWPLTPLTIRGSNWVCNQRTKKNMGIITNRQKTKQTNPPLPSECCNNCARKKDNVFRSSTTSDNQTTRPSKRCRIHFKRERCLRWMCKRAACKEERRGGRIKQRKFGCHTKMRGKAGAHCFCLVTSWLKWDSTTSSQGLTKELYESPIISNLIMSWR